MADVELPPPEPSPAEVRDATERILAGPEFEDDRSLLERVADWVVDRLSDLLDAFDGAGSGAGVLGAIVQLLLVAAIGAVLFFAVRALVRAVRARSSVGADDDGDGVTVVLGVPGDPASLRSAMEEAEQAGRWRDALLARYRFVVASLVADGVLADLPGRTTGEYQREFAEVRPEQSTTFGAATRAFEAAYYGHGVVGAGDVDDMKERTATLLGERIAAGGRR